MLKKISFNLRGKRINIIAKECSGLNRFLGLMFKDRDDANPLLFEFKKPVSFAIHSFFVFFPFIAVWMDEGNNVVEFKIVEPFSLSVKAKRQYKKLLEIPMNEKYNRKINFSSVIRKV